MKDEKRIEGIEVTDENMEEFDISKCNHDFNSSENSLEVMKLRRMVVPNTFMCYCKNCKKAFKFVKNNETEEYMIADQD